MRSQKRRPTKLFLILDDSSFYPPSHPFISHYLKTSATWPPQSHRQVTGDPAAVLALRWRVTGLHLGRQAVCWLSVSGGGVMGPLCSPGDCRARPTSVLETGLSPALLSTLVVKLRMNIVFIKSYSLVNWVENSRFENFPQFIK